MVLLLQCDRGGTDKVYILSNMKWGVTMGRMSEGCVIVAGAVVIAFSPFQA